MVGILQLTLVFVLRINFILTPLKTEEGKFKRSDWIKKMWLCTSVTACLESEGKEKGLRKRLISQSACRLGRI